MRRKTKRRKRKRRRRRRRIVRTKQRKKKDRREIKVKVFRVAPNQFIIVFSSSSGNIHFV